MKSKTELLLIIALGFMFASVDAQVDLINDEFPEAKQEVLETFGAIAQSIFDGDMDKLISFHAYGPKFTEFKNGELRNGSEANETHEREVFGAITEVVKFAANDLKIAVYGEVANLTFHSDFQLKFGEDLVVVNDQISLLFVNTEDGWKIVSEHHSPLSQSSIDIINCDLSGGEIATASGLTSISVCVGDGKNDPFDVRVSGASNSNSTWVITDEDGTILALRSNSRFDFETAGEGVCLIWHLNYEDELSGATIGMNTNDLEGCFNLSNPIVVTRLDCNNVCHAPLNLVLKEAGNKRITARWAKVNTADGYEILIGYEGISGSFVTIPVKSNKIKVSYRSDRTLQLSVRAICRDGSVSEYGDVMSYVPESGGEAAGRSGISSETTYGDFGVWEVKAILSPSPTQNFLKIDYDHGGRVDEISVWDIQGRKMLKTYSDPQLFSQQLDVSDLNEGTFILTITSEGDLLHTERFVKVK